jgi:hypothetical protein
VLNKSAVEFQWEGESEGVPPMGGKGLDGWDPAEERIVGHGFSVGGGHGTSVITISSDGTVFTANSRGVTAEGEDTSMTAVITLVDSDTLTWQGLDRKGGPLEGDGPKYTFKRGKCEHGGGEEEHGHEDDDDDDEDDDD